MGFILNDVLLTVFAFVHGGHLSVLEHQRFCPILANHHLHVLQLVDSI
jgi:hypothetical protein